MKYAIGSTVVLVACIVVGVLVSRAMQRRSGTTWSRGKKALVSVALSVAFFAVAALAYLLPYSPAEPAAKTALQGTATVHVSETSDGYLFDGPGTKTAMVFYPGAKVDSVAYAPLLSRLADQGLDCFLVDPPFHMALFASGAAGDLMAKHNYDQWIVGGHSLGGTTAARFASSNPDKVDALVLLAAYPTSEVPDDISLLSVYGTRDGVLEPQVYEESKEFWPEDSEELVIQGGNHAQFGCYGEQSGDETATISAEDLREQTAAAILAIN